jgi:hypothetical protein
VRAASKASSTAWKESRISCAMSGPEAGVRSGLASLRRTGSSSVCPASDGPFLSSAALRYQVSGCDTARPLPRAPRWRVSLLLLSGRAIRRPRGFVFIRRRYVTHASVKDRPVVSVACPDLQGPEFAELWIDRRVCACDTAEWSCTDRGCLSGSTAAPPASLSRSARPWTGRCTRSANPRSRIPDAPSDRRSGVDGLRLQKLLQPVAAEFAAVAGLLAAAERSEQVDLRAVDLDLADVDPAGDC